MKYSFIVSGNGKLSECSSFLREAGLWLVGLELDKAINTGCLKKETDTVEYVRGNMKMIVSLEPAGAINQINIDAVIEFAKSDPLCIMALKELNKSFTHRQEATVKGFWHELNGLLLKTIMPAFSASRRGHNWYPNSKERGNILFRLEQICWLEQVCLSDENTRQQDIH